MIDDHLERKEIAGYRKYIDTEIRIIPRSETFGRYVTARAILMDHALLCLSRKFYSLFIYLLIHF